MKCRHIIDQACHCQPFQLVKSMQTELKIRKILGKTYLNENRLADALDVFSKILLDYPDDIETLHILGNFYLASGDGKTAKKIYMRAQQLDPNNIAILRQITLADEMSDGGVEESIPTDLPAVARLLQRLTGTSQSVSEEDLLRITSLLEKIIASESPAELVARHLDEIDELMPALIELNIRQAYADGRPEIARSLQNLQANINYQLAAREEEKYPEANQAAPQARFRILLLLPDPDKKSGRISLVKSALESFGCSVSERRDYVAGRDAAPDAVITSNTHANPALIESLTVLSSAGIPILLDLDDDFEKQPISHQDYIAKGLGTHSSSTAYAAAISLAELVTVPSERLADSLKHLARKVVVIPDGWSSQNKLWHKEPNPHNTINIGWLGSSGQLEDLLSIRRFIVRIIREFQNTRVVIIGNPQAYRLFENLPNHRRLYLPSVAPEEFPYQLNQVDILLAPLRNLPYNASIPDTVLMEAGVKGIPWIASPIPAFQKWHDGGVLSESLDEWHLNLRHLIMDESLRRSLGEQGRLLAGAREMKQVGKLWLAAIQKMVNPDPSKIAAAGITVSS